MQACNPNPTDASPGRKDAWGECDAARSRSKNRSPRGLLGHSSCDLGTHGELCVQAICSCFTESIAATKALVCDATLSTGFCSSLAGNGAAKWARAYTRCPVTKTRGYSALGTLPSNVSACSATAKRVDSATSRSLWITSTQAIQSPNSALNAASRPTVVLLDLPAWRA